MPSHSLVDDVSLYDCRWTLALVCTPSTLPPETAVTDEQLTRIWQADRRHQSVSRKSYWFSYTLFICLLQRRSRSRQCPCEWREYRWRAATVWCGRRRRCRWRPPRPPRPCLSRHSHLSSRSPHPLRHPPRPSTLLYKNIPGRVI